MHTVCMHNDLLEYVIRNFSAILAEKKTSYADGVRTGQFAAKLKLHDKNMTALFVCSGESKSKF